MTDAASSPSSDRQLALFRDLSSGEIRLPRGGAKRFFAALGAAMVAGAACGGVVLFFGTKTYLMLAPDVPPAAIALAPWAGAFGAALGAGVAAALVDRFWKWDRPQA